MKKSTTYTLILSAALILIYIACGSYKVYFNTYYNAKRFYNQGIGGNEEEAEKDEKLIIPSVLDAAVGKFSKILELYPDSKYVDEALFCIGKIYYFRKNYNEAEVKFIELISNFPESNSVPEAHLWMAKVLEKQERFVDSDREYRIVIEYEDDDLKNKALLGLARLLFIQEDYTNAIDQNKSIIERVNNDNIRAQSQFNIGECYLMLNQYDKAAEEYLKVASYNPDHYYSFLSRFGYARSMKFAGDTEQAVQILRELLNDGKNSEFFSIIELEIANALFQSKKYEEAVKAYNDLVIYYKTGEEVAESLFNLGKIFLMVYTKLDSSLTFFKNADRMTKDLDLKDTLNVKVTTIENIKRYSLETNKWYGQRREYLEQVETQKDTLSEKNDNAKKLDIEQINKNEVKNRFLLAEQFYYGISWIDSAEVQLKTIINGLEPTEYTTNAYYLMSKIYERKGNSQLSLDYINQMTEKFPKSDMVFNVKKLNNDPVYLEKLNNSKNMYTSAETFVTSKDSITKAMSILQDIYENYPETEYAPKALYTLGWLHENYFADSAKTIDYYTKISDEYPFTEYAAAGEKRINILLSRTPVSSRPGGQNAAQKPKTQPQADQPQTVEIKPQIISNVKAEYIQSEKEKGYKGYVTIAMVINLVGKPLSIRIAKNTTGSELLGESAKKAASQCIFTVGLRNGKKVVMRVEKTFYFGIEENEKD